MAIHVTSTSDMISGLAVWTSYPNSAHAREAAVNGYTHVILTNLLHAVCLLKAAKISTFQQDMDDLEVANSTLASQLGLLTEQHEQLQQQCQAQHKELAGCQLELKDTRGRWVSEHGDLARGMQALQDVKRQVEEECVTLHHKMSELLADLISKETRWGQWVA